MDGVPKYWGLWPESPNPPQICYTRSNIKICNINININDGNGLEITGRTNQYMAVLCHGIIYQYVLTNLSRFYS